jgi:hypothetical protein
MIHKVIAKSGASEPFEIALSMVFVRLRLVELGEAMGS